MSTLRELRSLEALYMAIRRSGLREALAMPRLTGSERLGDLIDQLRRAEQELDWEMTGELLRLKDLVQARTHAYAQKRYGITVGGHIRFPHALANVPGKVRVTDIELLEDTEHDLKVTGNPVRDDGAVAAERVDLMVGGDGVKLRMPEAPKRDQLRGRVHR
jgi:hypothetical protein